MSWINDQLESRLRTVRQDGRMRPIIDQVKASGQTTTSDRVLQVAARAARDSFTREGVKAPSATQVRERAFLAAAAAATETPIVMTDIPKGSDKTQHFFMSGMISLKVAAFADKLLPRTFAEKLGVGASVTVGWLKEVYDHFFAPTGYNPEDLRADVAGAKRPFSVEVAK
jgi:uncharacterized protein YfiM (DUF2279 family)